MLASVAPSVLRYLQLGATAKDFFVAGPSGHAYTFPSRHLHFDAFAAQTAQYAQRADLHYVTALNENDADMGAVCDKYLSHSEVSGVLYKDWSPHNRSNGRLEWRHGKPCLSYRHLLWQGKTGACPRDVATALSQGPRKPLSDPRSFTLINVHAWSWGDDISLYNGPMGAVAATVAQLPPHVKVVTVEELMSRLSNLAPIYEAEGPRFNTTQAGPSPVAGRSPEVDSPGFMLYGPYVESLQPGTRWARFFVGMEGKTLAQDAVVAGIEVRDATLARVVAQRDLRATDFSSGTFYRRFSLSYAQQEGHRMEFRVHFNDQLGVRVDKVVVE